MTSSVFLCLVIQYTRYKVRHEALFCRADKIVGRADNAIVLTEQVNCWIPYVFPIFGKCLLVIIFSRQGIRSQLFASDGYPMMTSFPKCLTGSAYIQTNFLNNLVLNKYFNCTNFKKHINYKSVKLNRAHYNLIVLGRYIKHQRNISFDVLMPIFNARSTPPLPAPDLGS